MTLLEEWRNLAYDPNKQGTRENKALWDEYFELEKGVYEQLLAKPGRAVKGTFRELADKFELSDMFMTGFLDGINDSLKKPNPIEEMDQDTPLSLGFDKAKLYKNMVHAQADWLYGLPQWDEIFSKEEQEALYKEAKNENTVRHEAPKVYPNDPCPCGSGKKYKKCCMLKEA